MGGFDFDGMMGGAYVGIGVGSEVWRSFIRSFWMGMDDGLGMIVR